ncbi:MAG: hypothetical protein Q9218_001651 [Villophora microphyllina]
MARSEGMTAFLSLPGETRVFVYEGALTAEAQIVPQYRLADQQSLAGSLLLTRKQIYSEASVVLYSKNTFLIDDPNRDFDWLMGTGAANVSNLRCLRIWPYAPYHSYDISWHRLLNLLARKAIGRRDIYLYLDADPDDDGTWRCEGAGKEVKSIRRLAGIQNLRSLSINEITMVGGSMTSMKVKAQVSSPPLFPCASRISFLQTLNQYIHGPAAQTSRSEKAIMAVGIEYIPKATDGPSVNASIYSDQKSVSYVFSITLGGISLGDLAGNEQAGKSSPSTIVSAGSQDKIGYGSP